MRIYSTDTVEKVGEEIELAGWVDARRDHGKLIFIDLRDKNGIVQLVFNAKDLNVITKAETPPIEINSDGYDINEEIRMKYRYIDLRRSRMQRNILLRHKTSQFARNYLSDKGFVEIETPILTKSTPEGA